MKRTLISALLLGVLAASSLNCLRAAEPVDTARRAEELKNLRWGMFICWSFSTFSGKEWTPGVTDVNFFKATGCDTDQWARSAKEAGMGYILFLTKHHDGFCLWDTKTTDRKVTKATLGRDVLAELRKSCDKHGIKLALYFSEGDWSWPGSVQGGKSAESPEIKKAQLRELLTQYGPIEYIWFDHAVGEGGLSHQETVAWCKQFQPGCFVGFNHGDQADADIRLGEMGRPGPLADHSAAGPHMHDAAGRNYRLAEFTYPILPPHKGGAMWFYSLPEHDQLCLPAEKLYGDYLGAARFGNIFSIDVGPDYAGKLREVDVRTLCQVGEMIRRRAPHPDVAKSLVKPGTIATGPFEPFDDALRQYRCPDWFRDAKLGIWAVWGPESVPMQGDWYARRLYLEGDRHNKYHVEHYGHPSKFGFKDIIPLWKAERWEPEKLMSLYKKAGAKYFCMIAEHHDNFDCWNSRFQPWNSVNMGPHRDIAGQWQQAAQKNGLRFGMTEHLAASWWFYSAAKGADAHGPMAGVAYDGKDPKYADLYWADNEKPAENYYCPHGPTHIKETWFNRIKDMIDRYHPDLLYSDSPLPYPEEVGRQLLAHYYNDSAARHGGVNEAVYNCKQASEGRWVQDLERGVMDGISPHPWQTDTCVGEWYYDEQVLAHHGYKTPATVVHMLCDIVSKNGNLLLNFPPRPDGTLDDDELKILDAMAAWISVNGEAIYGTRPWLAYGEGAKKIQSGGFNEGKLKYTAKDIRFTTKAGSLYAIALGWPENGKLTIRSLATAAGPVSAVSLLGHDGKLPWQQTAEGLEVTLPQTRPCDLAWSFKIAGEDLKPVPVPIEITRIAPDATGKFILPAQDAEIHGNSPVYEAGGGKDQIGFWGNPKDYVSWYFQSLKPGDYKVEVTYSCDAGVQGSQFTVEVGDQKLTGTSKSTGSWASYTTETLGTIHLDKTGVCTLAVKPKAEPKWKVIGLKSITLSPK
jgi:alpha-L-fucosidase